MINQNFVPMSSQLGIPGTSYRALVKQSKQKKEQQKVMVPIFKVRDIKLKKVPESELKRPKVQGWIKEKNYLKSCPTCNKNLD